MAKREDGRETRGKLLTTACAVFAQKGYRDAKVADICKRAGANVAAVNYYFGDKASLYKETWMHALENFDEPSFPEAAAGSPQDALRDYIETLIKDFSANNERGQFSRLYLRELVNPTGLIQDAWREMIEPRRRILHRIIRAIIGPEAGQLNILFCELSIINQCRALVTIKNSDLEYMLGQALSPELITQLARHIAEFSLAGIQAAAQSTA